jgi:hypothetical protein
MFVERSKCCDDCVYIEFINGPYIRLDLYVLWRIDPLLGNDSVNTFPREPTRETIGRLLLGNGAVYTLDQQYKLYFLRRPCEVL